MQPNPTSHRGQRLSLLLSVKPDYHDSPANKNPWEKIWGLGKYAFTGSLLWGFFDGVALTQASNYLEFINCVGHWVVPAVGMSVAFSSVTYMAASIRNKDDKLNYACGALSCGPILRAWKNSPGVTYGGTAFLVIWAVVYKEMHDNGLKLFPEYDHYYGNLKYDFTCVNEDYWPKRPV